MSVDERFRIPEVYRAGCELCGEDLDVRRFGVYQWTAGWVKQRAGGGGHGISLAQRERRWAHDDCVERVAAGTWSPDQTSLF